MSTFAERLRLLRGKKSQADFSAEIGLSQRSFSRYETGAGSPDLKLIQKICLILNIEPRWLVSGEGPISTDVEYKASDQKKSSPDILKEKEPSKYETNQTKNIKSKKIPFDPHVFKTVIIGSLLSIERMKVDWTPSETADHMLDMYLDVVSTVPRDEWPDKDLPEEEIESMRPNREKKDTA